MGKRSRKRQDKTPVATTDYTDPDGNVLTLRDSAKLDEPAVSAAANAEDVWQRRTEMLFERYAVRWTIAGLPIEKQKELLARYRFADQATREWIRSVIDGHMGSA